MDEVTANDGMVPEQAAQLGRLAEYDQLLASKPEDADAWFGRAEVLVQLGREAEALLSYERALEGSPRMALAHRGKALVLRALGKKAEALEAVERALEVDSSLSLAWRSKGAILRDLGRDQEGLVCYDKGLEIDPKDTVLLCNRGNVLRKLGRFNEALTSYDKALSIDPSCKYAIEGRTQALSGAGRVIDLAHLDLGGDQSAREHLVRDAGMICGPDPGRLVPGLDQRVRINTLRTTTNLQRIADVKPPDRILYESRQAAPRSTQQVASSPAKNLAVAVKRQDNVRLRSAGALSWLRSLVCRITNR